MARAQLKMVVTDQRGNALRNARVVVCESGTTTPVTDLFANPTGGAAIVGATLTSNAQGEIEGYLDEERDLALIVNDNGHAAVFAADPAKYARFNEFTEDPVPVYENPVDENTDDVALAAVVVAVADHLADTTDAHDASAISYAGAPNMTAANVEAALDELAPIGLFTAVSATPPAIPAARTLVATTGYSTVGVGAASYVYDAAVNAGTVAANPRTQFLAADGRGYRLVAQNNTPWQFGCVGGTTDDGVALNAFFAFITANDVGSADASGSFQTTIPIVFGAAGVPATLSVKGKFALTAKSGSSGAVLLTVNQFFQGRFEHLRLIGTGGTSYASRTWEVGLQLTGSSGGRNSFPKVFTDNFSFAGIALVGRGGDNLIGNAFGPIRASDIGSGAFSGADHSYSLQTTWSNPVRTGTQSSSDQLTTVNVGTLPPAHIINGTYGAVGTSPYMLRVTYADGSTRLHFISAIDSVNSKISVHPWIPASAVPGTADYVWGGALYILGGNAGICTFDYLDIVRCGIGLLAGATYNPWGRCVEAQVCGAVIVIGSDPSSNCFGGHLDASYYESSSENIVFLARPTPANSTYTLFASDYTLDLAKVYVVPAARSNADVESAQTISLNRSRLSYRGRLMQWEKEPYNYPYTSTSSPTFEVERADQQVLLVGDTLSITGSIDANKHRLMGYDHATLTVAGTGANGQPTGTLTFLVPAGYTLNGGAVALTFSGFTRPARFLYRFDVLSANVVVVPLVGGRVTSALADSASLQMTTSYDRWTVAALTQAATIANPTGTPVSGQLLELRIKSAAAQTLSFGSQFRAGTDLALPTTTTGSSKTDYMGFEWNSADSKWDLIFLLRGY